MTFGENELILGRHDPAVQMEHRVEGGQVAADMTDLRLVMHLKEPRPGHIRQ